MRVLWLVSWYPNKIDAYNGDFIQRMARAVSSLDDVYVIHLVEAKIKDSLQRVINTDNRLIEEIIYIKETTGLLSKVKKQFLYNRVYKKAIESYILKYGLPHCVHVQVPWKAGLLALWTLKKFHIQFVVTEHWGIYSSNLEENYFTKPLYFRKLVNRIFRESSKLITVSHLLGTCINEMVLSKNFIVIPNVVDTSLFKPSAVKNKRFTFLHVSNMVPLKNVGEILQSFAMFKHDKENNAQLILIGNRDETYVRMAEKIGLLNEHIFFRDELSYRAVAEEMQRAHCLILNSSFETFSCVIAEALCCGIPVITTNVGVVPDIINQRNGVIIDQRNRIDGLMNAMESTMQRYSFYDSEIISKEAAERFSYFAVSTQIHELYIEIVGSSEKG